MKSIFYKIFIVFVAAVLACAFVSCGPETPEGPDNPDPEKPAPGKPEPLDDTIVIGEEVIAVASAAVENYGDYISFTISTIEGLESSEEMIARETGFLYAVVVPTLIGREIDMTAEPSQFTVMSAVEGLSIEGIAPGNTAEIRSGTMLIEKADNVYTLDIALVMADETEVFVNATAMADDIRKNENYISIDGAEKPVRKAFYGVSDGMAMLYLTPADIDYFDELEMATYYIGIMCPQDALTGEKTDITSYEGEGLIFYMDNATEQLVSVSMPVTDASVGTFSISEVDSEEMIVDAMMDITFADGTKMKAEFKGQCVSVDEEEEIPNKYIYEESSFPIYSVVFDETQGEFCDIYLTSEKDIATVEEMVECNPVKLTIKTADIGMVVGFSFYPEAAISYDGVIYNSENGGFGTIITTAGDSETEFTIEFTNYTNLEGYYKGQVVRIR